MSREEKVAEILNSKPKGALHVLAFGLAKGAVVGAVMVQVVWNAYDLLTQATWLQKNFWDNTLWRGQKQWRHLFRNENEAFWGHVVGKQHVAKGIRIKKVLKVLNIGRGALGAVTMPFDAFERHVLHLPTTSQYVEQDFTFTRKQRNTLRCAIAVRGVVVGTAAAVVANKMGVPIYDHAAHASALHPLTHVAAAHAGAAAHGGGAYAGGIWNYIKAEPSGWKLALTTNLPAKAIGFAAGFGALSPMKLLGQARTRRIAAAVYDKKKTYRYLLHGPAVWNAVQDEPKLRAAMLARRTPAIGAGNDGIAA